MNLRLILCGILLGLPLGGCDGGVITDDAETDQELTAEELAQLPDPLGEADEVQLAQAELAPVDDATALFGDDQADETVDQAVEEDERQIESIVGSTRVTGLDGPSSATGAQPDPGVYASSGVLKWGIHPRASDALRSIGVSSWRIMQTIGHAAASAGTHAQDGVVNGHAYSSATDISVSGLSSTQIRNLLERMGRVGFAAFYRQPGYDGWPSYEVRHIHAVYANSKMKTALRSQVRSWLAGRNGLVSNSIYHFYNWSATARATVRHKFAQSNYGTTNAGASCVVGGAYCGGDKISGDHSTLYRCTGIGAPSVIRHCAKGCSVNPGRDDSCR